MHKSTGDKIGIPDGLVIYRLADAVASVLPLGRHASYIVAEVPQHMNSDQSQLNCPTTY